MRIRTLYRRPACLVPLDLWLWAAALAMLAAGGAAHASGDPVAGFTAALVAVAVTSAVMGRAVDQLGGRLRPAVIGTFQAVIGNVPELIIGIMALQQGLVLVVQAAVIGSTLNLLLLGNGLAFVVGGLRHRTLPIDPHRTQITRVALVMLITILMAPALAVMLRTPRPSTPRPSPTCRPPRCSRCSPSRCRPGCAPTGTCRLRNSALRRPKPGRPRRGRCGWCWRCWPAPAC
ncbi:hypothetical protein ACFQXA_03005 [Nocardiopsis composta]